MDAQIALLHFSDIHLRNDSNHILQRVDMICDSVISRVMVADEFNLALYPEFIYPLIYPLGIFTQLYLIAGDNRDTTLLFKMSNKRFYQIV